MSDETFQTVRLLLSLPSAGIGVAALALCWRNRRAKPRAAVLFAAGLLVLLGKLGLGGLLWETPGLGAELINLGFDYTAVWTVWAAFAAATDVLAGVLVTCAVFLPEPDRAPPPVRPDPPGTTAPRQRGRP